MWRRGIGRAPPRAYLQADLDIVSPPGMAPADALLCDAEAIRAVIEVGPAQHASFKSGSLMRDIQGQAGGREAPELTWWLCAQVLQALPETHGEWEVRLGHAVILEAALVHAHVPRVRTRSAPPAAKPGRCDWLLSSSHVGA